MSKKLTQVEFIQKAQAVHGLGKYDYRDVIYAGTVAKIKIGCPWHGAFTQMAGSHLQGSGCPKCSNAQLGQPRTTLAAFIDKAIKVHGLEYDYSKTQYLHSHAMVVIACPAHGEFSISANQHIAGYGCQKCGALRLGAYKRGNAVEFVSRARACQKAEYDYSMVNYKNSKTKVVIGCPLHGAFEQTPAVHLKGIGCPVCSGGRGGQSAKNWVDQVAGRRSCLYFLRVYNNEEQFYKVGVTILPISARYRSKKSLGGYQYEVLAQYLSMNALAVYDWEQSIIETFARLQYVPKNAFGGQFECFSSCEEILEVFPL